MFEIFKHLPYYFILSVLISNVGKVLSSAIVHVSTELAWNLNYSVVCHWFSLQLHFYLHQTANKISSVQLAAMSFTMRKQHSLCNERQNSISINNRAVEIPC